MLPHVGLFRAEWQHEVKFRRLPRRNPQGGQGRRHRRGAMVEKLGTYLLVLSACAVAWGLYELAEAWGWQWSLAAGGAGLLCLMWWAEFELNEACDRFPPD
jgi:hypothetical protein